MGQEYYPISVMARNSVGEWTTYTVVRRRCSRAFDGSRGLFIQTGRMVDDGIVIPFSQRMYDAFGYQLWQDHPAALTLNFTFRTESTGLVLTGIVYDGEFYPLNT